MSPPFSDPLQYGSYDELRYVKRRFVQKDALRSAITHIVNGIFRIHQPAIWGIRDDILCCGLPKDQNLMPEWHARYGGRGVMMEGVLRHCTDMEINHQYVDNLYQITHYRHVNDTITSVPFDASLDNWLYGKFGPLGTTLGFFWTLAAELPAQMAGVYVGEHYWHHGSPVVFFRTMQTRTWLECKAINNYHLSKKDLLEIFFYTFGLRACIFSKMLHFAALLPLGQYDDNDNK